MNTKDLPYPRRPETLTHVRRAISIMLACALAAAGLFLVAPSATAAQSKVGLGTAETYGVLAGSSITNTGPTTIAGDLGLDPGSSVTGAPVVTGSTNVNNPAAVTAKSDLTTAYNDAAGRTPAATISTDLDGLTLVGGVYSSATSMALAGAGTVTLDAENDPDAVFIFQAGTTLTTGSDSTVALVRGAQACNVFWQVGSSATLGTDTTFVGTAMADQSITLNTGTTVAGRVLAQVGGVTMDTNTITRPTTCITGTTDGGDGDGGVAAPTPTPIAQYPVKFPKPLLPGKIKPDGLTTLFKRPVKTNAGTKIKLTISCPPTLRGDMRICVRVKGPKGGWKIRTFGIKANVTVTLSAPAKNGYAAYKFKKKYKIR